MTTITKDKNVPLNYIEFLTSAKMGFLAQYGKHSVKVINGDYNINFVSSVRSDRFFNATKKVESDVSKFPIPDIDEENVHYFNHDIRNEIHVSKVHCIDINSAYATALKLKNILTESTYKYISLLSKPERLSCIGMLAKETVIIRYREGEACEHEVKTNPYRPFFFLSVQEISDIMRAIKMEAYKEYIMTWVDCIYLSDKRKIPGIISFLNSQGYSAKYNYITDFNVTLSDTKIRIDYRKYGKPVYMFIPNTVVLTNKCKQDGRGSRALQDFRKAIGI